MGFRHFPNPPGTQFDWLHGLFTLLMVAAIVAGVVLIARQWRRPLPPPAWGPQLPQSPAIHELDVRYARGEIDRTDYIQRRAAILGTTSAPLPGPTPGAPPS